MAKAQKRLRRRLREAVSASAEPQLQRGTEIEESVSQAERDQAVKDKDAFPDGSFPIKTQKQAEDAWDLRGHNENHSEASIVAHIRGQVEKHGLKMPGQTRESVSLHTLLREASVERKGSAYEVTIVREGPGNPEDSNYYTAQALREAVSEGLFEGLRAYLNHPTPTEERERPERDVRYLAGHFREARFVQGKPAEVRAKFIPGGMDKDGVVALIESALGSVPGRPLIGISIDGYGHAPDQQHVGGRTYNMVREVTHLGSADIVTRAGAGGQFHRRLQEAARETRASTPAAQAGEPLKEGTMKPAKLQEKIKSGVAKLREASEIKDDDDRANGLIKEALSELDECGTASVDPEVKIQEKVVEKPVAASDEDKDKLAAQLAAAETKLREAQDATAAEKRRRKDAESELQTIKSVQTAVRVMREAKVPKASAEAWLEDVAALEDEPAMKGYVERKLSEREAIVAELRESFVEGNPARTPAHAGAPASGGLLDRMGIDRDEPAAA